MFDDAQNNIPAGMPPSNLPSEPVDMFAGVEKPDENPSATDSSVPNALSAGKLQRKESPKVNTMPNLDTPPIASTIPASVSTYEVRGPVLGKIILFVVSAIVLGGVGFGGWWAYMRFFNTPPVSPAVTLPNSNNTSLPPASQQVTVDIDQTASEDNIFMTDTSTEGDISTEINSDKILFGNQIDSDRDGLDDAREKELGTNFNNSDTDGDGLNDYDEVVVWKTDPLNSDTDGDSYGDGQEVSAGYNPMGQGKLELPISTTTP